MQESIMVLKRLQDFLHEKRLMVSRVYSYHNPKAVGEIKLIAESLHQKHLSLLQNQLNVNLYREIPVYEEKTSNTV